jgi:hypothetical protein
MILQKTERESWRSSNSYDVYNTGRSWLKNIMVWAAMLVLELLAFGDSV